METIVADYQFHTLTALSCWVPRKKQSDSDHSNYEIYIHILREMMKRLLLLTESYQLDDMAHLCTNQSAPREVTRKSKIQ